MFIYLSPNLSAHPGELNFPYRDSRALSDMVLTVLTKPSCRKILNHKRALSIVDSHIVTRLLKTENKKLSLFLSEIKLQKTQRPIHKAKFLRKPKYAIAAHPFINTCGASSIKPLGAMAIYSALLACPSLRAKYDSKTPRNSPFPPFPLPDFLSYYFKKVNLTQDIARMITKSDNAATRRIFGLLEDLDNECNVTSSNLSSPWGLHNALAEKLGLFSTSEGGTFACGTIYKNCSNYNINSFSIPDQLKTKGHLGSQFITIDSQAKFYLALINQTLFAQLGSPAERNAYSLRLINDMVLPSSSKQFANYFARAKNQAMPPSYGVPCTFLKQDSIRPKGAQAFPKRCLSFKPVPSLGGKVLKIYRKSGSLPKKCANDFAYIQFENKREYMIGVSVNLLGDPAMKGNKNYELNNKIMHDLRLILGAINKKQSHICEIPTYLNSV